MNITKYVEDRFYQIYLKRIFSPITRLLKYELHNKTKRRTRTMTNDGVLREDGKDFEELGQQR